MDGSNGEDSKIIKIFNPLDWNHSFKYWIQFKTGATDNLKLESLIIQKQKVLVLDTHFYVLKGNYWSYWTIGLRKLSNW